MDKNSGYKFLVDTGAVVSVFPKNKYSKLNDDFSLYAANGSKINTYGHKRLTLNLGLRREFPWTFIIADVNRPILGADFLENFGLIIDIKNRRIIDNLTSISAICEVKTSPSLGLTTISGDSPYHKILSDYPTIINPAALGTAKKPHNITHCIITKGPPVHSKARRLSPQKLAIVKSEIKNLLEQGIIRPSKSPWASPIHLVPKKTGGWRLCGDFSRVNAVTVCDRYPLPHIQDFVYGLQGKQIFSKIDLVKAYHQIPLDPDSIAKTAIICPIGLYEYSFMCFGLSNAAQTFQRFMDEVLRDIDCCYSYLDDILVASENEEQHKKDIQTVLQRLSDYGIVLNVDKCEFGKNQLNFLGFLVTAAGIAPLPEKVEILSNYPLPSTVDSLRRFLAMINFYHRFLANTAETQAPLYDLVKGKKKKDQSSIQWSEETLAAFNACKDSIAKSTVLAHPIPNADLSLMVDASSTAIGSVLQQTRNTDSRSSTEPLAFFSRKLSPAEKNYSVYDRELLAIYSSVKYFRHMVEGRPFIVYTDHRPLTYAFTKSHDNSSPRQQRHLEFIAQFTTDIRYVPGDKNVVADTLSRIAEVELLGNINYAAMAHSQANDHELRSLLDSDVLKLKPFSFIQDAPSLLCDTSTGSVRPYVPADFRQEVFRTMHNLSHPGVKATVKLIKERFVWKNLRKDVSTWAKSCVQCQRSKVQRHTKSPLGSYPLPQCRFWHVNIDIIGPLPPSKGMRYCLTCTDRFTRWPEAFPMPDQTADTVASTFYAGWIARFGVPELISTDQGRQFESELFRSLAKFLGIQKNRTTAYNPKSNGLVERSHRQLKSAIKCKAADNWVDVLPSILLGIRASFKEDIGATTAELVYGSTLRLPGEFFRSSISSNHPTCSEFLRQIREHIQSLRPVPASNHSAQQNVFVSKELTTCTHVFVRQDHVRKPLQQPYEGPFKVLERKGKSFRVQVKGKDVNIGIDRLKPAFIMPDDIPQPHSRPEVITRSGRKVRFAQPFQAS